MKGCSLPSQPSHQSLRVHAPVFDTFLVFHFSSSADARKPWETGALLILRLLRHRAKWRSRACSASSKLISLTTRCWYTYSAELTGQQDGTWWGFYYQPCTVLFSLEASWGFSKNYNTHNPFLSGLSICALSLLLLIEFFKFREAFWCLAWI